MTSKLTRVVVAITAVLIAASALVFVLTRYDLNWAAALTGLVAVLVGGVFWLVQWVRHGEGRPLPRRRTVTIVAVATVLVLAVAGTLYVLNRRVVPRGTLRVLAGNSLKDFEPILKDAEAVTGVHIEMDFQAGTLDAVERVMSGDAARNYDAIWFPSNGYLRLQDGIDQRLGAANSIATSPVILGLRPEEVEKLQWGARRPAWKEIAGRGERREFTFGMTDPIASNSGYSALVSIAAAFADTTKPLTKEQISAQTVQLRQFFRAQALTSGSSGWLSERYEKAVKDGQPISGLINYESELLKLNLRNNLPKPLKLIYPDDGAVLADFPLTLLKSASAEATANYNATVDYLRRIRACGHRASAADRVALA